MSAIPRAAAQVAQKSGFASQIISQARGAIRNFEPHPFGVYPKSVKSAPADWGRVGARFNSSMAVYIPFMTAFFSWPFMLEYMIRGNM